MPARSPTPTETSAPVTASVADGRNDGGRRDWSNAGYGHEPLTGFMLGGPAYDRRINFRDLVLQPLKFRHQLCEQ